MSTAVEYTDYAQKALEIISKGAFLTTAALGKVNTMTIGWASIGPVWRKPIFMVMVRPSRYTYDLIQSEEFTVSVPFSDMKEALAFCGTKSGRALDKIKAAGLTLVPGQKVSVPVILGNCLNFECRIVYKQKMEPKMLDTEYDKACYPEGDYHTMYYGEIVACYLD